MMDDVENIEDDNCKLQTGPVYRNIPTRKNGINAVINPQLIILEFIWALQKYEIRVYNTCTKLPAVNLQIG